MRTSVAVVTLAVVCSACASRRALREDTTTDVVALKDASARRAYYRAAVSVMSREGYRLLHESEPDGFRVYHERLRPALDGREHCEDVRLDASFETSEDRAAFVFVPCQVERKAALFAENGLEICVPQAEWRRHRCIETAVARLKAAWREEAQERLAREAHLRHVSEAASRPSPVLMRGSQADPAGCMKDTECKGDRICDSGRCVDSSRR